MEFRLLHALLIGAINLKERSTKGVDVGVGPLGQQGSMRPTSSLGYPSTFRHHTTCIDTTRHDPFTTTLPSDGLGPLILECQASIRHLENGHGRPSGQALGAPPNP